MDIQDKTPINVGLFGHIDSGKTMVAEALSTYISTAGIDAHPQSKERGITIDLGFTSFILGDYLINLVDAPGHADLIKISASSIEIIDLALIVIDVNKGPQIQTGEHLIMIDSLNIDEIIVILNKTDIFEGDIEKEIQKTRNFFKTTPFGSDIPIFPVSAIEKEGLEPLKEELLEKVSHLELSRNYEGDAIIPIDHHFLVKGRGPVITGTVVSGSIAKNQTLHILPINSSGQIKNIQIFHHNVDSAATGNRVGVNIKDIDIDKVYRGCYATDNPSAFELCKSIEIKGYKTTLFKHKIPFGSQIHVTIGMSTEVGMIYPYTKTDGKRVKKSLSSEHTNFRALLKFNEKILIRKNKAIMLLSRLDLPPTTLRIVGSAELIEVHEDPPLFYRYKRKRGNVSKPNHPQGIVCTGLAESLKGARKIVGRKLEPPFTEVLDTFGTKGAVIVGIEDRDINVNKNDEVILKELRHFQVK
jgi:selenocysteine-specific elongation factor